MKSGSSALHAIRLILGGWRAREEASLRMSILGRLRYNNTRPSLSSNFTFYQNPPQSDDIAGFLEDDSEDYAAALRQLPDREISPLRPAWPAPRSGSSSSRPCDSVAKAVAQEDFTAARDLFLDLRSVRIKLVDRHEYRHAALDALKNNDVEAFLDWMDHYPYNIAVLNDPASVSSKDPEIFKTLRPIIRTLRASYLTDTSVITRFLQLCARKGLLAPIIEHFITDLGTLLRPEASLPVLVNVLNAFGASIPDTVDEDDKEAFQREVVIPRMNKWLNTYMRKVALAGWAEQAQTLYDELPTKLAYVEWVPITREIVQRRQVPMIRAEEAEGLVLRERIRSALQTAPRPRVLALLLDDLEELSSTHPTMADRFRRHLIRRPGDTLRPIGQTRGERKLDQAEIYRLSRHSRHVDAIRYFLERYIYRGLPPHPLVESMQPRIEPVSKGAGPHIPSIHIITTLLPSLLVTLPGSWNSSVFSFHLQYMNMANELPPIQQPTHATHSVFIKHIIWQSGMKDARTAFKGIAERGFDPGGMAASWLLLAYAKMGSFDAVEAMLNRMQNQVPISNRLNSHIKWSPPPPGTLDTMASIVERKATMQPGYWERFAANIDARAEGEMGHA